jgi:hypothetical protein
MAFRMSGKPGSRSSRGDVSQGDASLSFAAILAKVGG